MNRSAVLWLGALGVASLTAIVCIALGVYHRANRPVAFLLGIVAFLALTVTYFFTSALFPSLVDARFYAYASFYRGIQPGMTRAEVLDFAARRYPAGGARQRPKIMGDTPDALGFFMNPESSREPNCEGIFLQFQDGRVIDKVYSAD